MARSQSKVYLQVAIKSVEKECGGLDRFVPASLTESMKKKVRNILFELSLKCLYQELRKLLTHFLKLNSNLVSPGQKFLTGLQAKLHYLKIISELPSYGAKCFSTNISVSIGVSGTFQFIRSIFISIQLF